MVVPYKRFFDLDRAAATGQRLLKPKEQSQPREQPQHGEQPRQQAPGPAPAAEPALLSQTPLADELMVDGLDLVEELAEQTVEPAAATVGEPAAARIVWSSFERPPVTYKLELWDALLEWVRLSLQASGCFALDERGFLVASSGDMGSVPPEVFLSAFTSTDETLTPYTGSPGSLHGAMLELEAGQVSLLPVQLPEAQVLLGLLGGVSATAKQQESIRRTMVDELEHFDVTHR